MNMNKWIEDIINSPVKKPFPVLTFPSVGFMNMTVEELVSSSDNLANGIKIIADKVDMPAALGYMDLSIEAEAFGANTVYSANEVPNITGSIADTEEAAEALKVPEVGAGRTGKSIEAIAKARKLITDKPLIAGTIGPFSMAGRLMGVSNAMIFCYDEPDLCHILLRKSTDFLIKYILEFKKAGADAVLIAEPLAGILSPSLCQEFSTDYIKEIVEAVQDEDFILLYHNCGNEAVRLIDVILDTGCKAYHFGDAIDMADMMPHIPADILAMGNLKPAYFRNSTTEEIRQETLNLLEKCGKYPNFLISSGCDVPPTAKWENVEAFFDAAAEFYSK
ncbi:uroporphyrinogen decarboxylase family protein [Parasporobacterium paucivorans]|uniref:Uroporphyrinogen decarboxylase n=1 Tax=Parasporobacterium paucivorans DSM 15970 TaxID=1122934 RepID=A0A1M6BWZ5_9FIRM|nr:uroporphyrinogen decarboxylase family protein [Parasporobacterium paucivorans]SHI53285.1 uroporphyrinogen decarboxylase [Parasporobacterium paucivorans DSM 15970]